MYPHLLAPVHQTQTAASPRRREGLANDVYPWAPLLFLAFVHHLDCRKFKIELADVSWADVFE